MEYDYSHNSILKRDGIRMSRRLFSYADLIIKVMKEIRAEIMRRLNDDEEVRVDQVEDITRRAFEKSAEFYGVTEQTVISKCTKELGLNIQDFYGLVKLYLLTDNTTLEEIIITHMPDGESEPYIRQALQKVRTEL